MNEEQSQIVVICDSIQHKWLTLINEFEFRMLDPHVPNGAQSFKEAFQTIDTNLGKLIQELSRRGG